MYIIITESEMIPVLTNGESNLPDLVTADKFSLWIICGLDHIFTQKYPIWRIDFEIDLLNIVTSSANGTQRIWIWLDVLLSLYQTPACRH